MTVIIGLFFQIFVREVTSSREIASEILAQSRNRKRDFSSLELGVILNELGHGGSCHGIESEAGLCAE